MEHSQLKPSVNFTDIKSYACVIFWARVAGKRIFVCVLLCVYAFPVFGQVKAVKKIDVGYGWSRTMVNATVFRYNSIVSYNDFQYVAYYDSNSRVVLAKRRHGTAKWITKQTRFTGNTMDAHNAIAIMVDGRGVLHMAWDHHGNALNYCMGQKPGSLEMGPPQKMIGRDEGKVTYSEFYAMPSGDLIFVYRDGSSGDGNFVMNRYDLETGRWRRLHDNLIDGEGQRNAYWQMYVSQSGVIHLSWVWRESYNVETNHDMCYAVSGDGGRTWFTSEQKRYQLPITKETAEYVMRIPENSDLINQTSITADTNDNPYIGTYFQAADDSCPQYYILYKRNKTWQLSRASSRSMDFDLGGMGSRSIPVSRPQLVFRHGHKTNLYLIYRDDEYGGKARLAFAEPETMNWSAVDLTAESLERWEPSYDTELWKKKNQLHLFLQKVGQESGEKSVEMPPQPVSILEVILD